MNNDERRFLWPNGSKCAVVLSFDVDGEAGMISLDPTNRELISTLSAGTYGPRVGVPRILRLLKDIGVQATFFVPGYTAELHPGLLESIASNGHEVAHHGYLHKRMDLLTEEEAREELERGLEVLTQRTGERPVGYRAPWWQVRSSTVDLLVQQGFLYDSSLMADDIPYRLRAEQGDLIELPVSFILDDWEQFGYVSSPPTGYCIEDVDKVFRMWKDEFDALSEEQGCFVLTMHPWLIGRASRIVMLRKLIEHIISSKAAWIATAREVASLAEGCFNAE